MAGFTAPVWGQQGPLGIFEGQQDIGPVRQAGSARYSAQNRQYTLRGGGINVWGRQDEFQYLFKKMTGDFILYTRAAFVGQGTDPHRKLGWMVRRTLEPDAAHASAVVHGDGLTSLQYRKGAGAETEEKKASVTHADVIQLERKGQTYTMSVAQFGKPFETVQVANLDLGDAVYVGLFLSAHHPDVIEAGTFRDLRIAVPAPDDLVQYRQYLGSHLEIMEVATGDREIIYSSPKSLQAPNWTPDGKTLIYNSDGLIYTFDLATRQPKVLETGQVKNNNNDHVLSMDGKMLGLSSGVAELGGSIVYTVPVTGGKPKQITPRGPSYLHGWSPDNKYLIYTAERNGDFDIYRIPAQGGKEVNLTKSKGLDDGSEYTPSGKHIYFNSSRGGSMSVWRMQADGSKPEPITDNAFHDWFPHISPDGQWIVFLSFLKEEVAADDHPFYKHVYLRLLPIGGGEPRVIGYLYGGQGTINTPSWSPDSKKIAFISNSADIK